MSTLIETAAELLKRLLPEPRSDVIEPRPRVTPDPERAAELERRFGDLAYAPQQADFHRDQRQQRRDR